jgi:hypothetical protein
MNGMWDPTKYGLRDHYLLLLFGATLGNFWVELLLISIELWAGYRKLKDTGQPIVGSCDVAISAACHPAEDMKTDEISEEELQ